MEGSAWLLLDKASSALPDSSHGAVRGFRLPVPMSMIYITIHDELSAHLVERIERVDEEKGLGGSGGDVAAVGSQHDDEQRQAGVGEEHGAAERACLTRGGRGFLIIRAGLLDPRGHEAAAAPAARWRVEAPVEARADGGLDQVEKAERDANVEDVRCDSLEWECCRDFL